ncbi:Mog1p/PsbP-like protein [Parathielavia hyrcaniae]|uniref:Mog1p/PsbP-like protein n=1 Tax=Parathielavia hyrcaniae TaxID=113614 RepID=A0AAN6PUB8_9PEZI|nr:Mog1p/PsbP-like protein [Parathielavia hyrcaniae]
MPHDGYKKTGLFGGALECELPDKFADVSTIRQVPDNQEVYIDKDGFTSIIFDITQRVDAPGEGLERDGRALTIHLEDLVGEDADTVKVWNTTETQFSHLDDDTPAYTLIATQTPHSSSSSNPDDEARRGSAPDFTALILTLLRFEREKTDVLITINVPHIRGEYDEDEVDLALGKQGELIGDAVEYAARIWSTFKVRRWGLFDEV